MQESNNDTNNTNIKEDNTNNNGKLNNLLLFEGLSEQQRNAKLRERMLRFWLSAVGHPVILKMQEKYVYHL